MKELSMRSQLALWYAVLLMFLLNLVVAAVYFSLRTALLKEYKDSLRETTFLLEKSIRGRGEEIYFDPDEIEEGIIPGLFMYALYTPAGVLVDGRYTSFIDEPALSFGKVRLFHHDFDHWFVYDKKVVPNGRYQGRVRVLWLGTDLVDSFGVMRIIWLVSLAPCLLVSLAGGNVMARSALKPMRNIAGLALEIGRGNFNQRILVKENKDELGELIIAFNDMAENVQRAFDREKQFTSDASHEMRTPVAVIIAHAEDAGNDDSLETYRKTNKVILSKARHLQKMLSQLLVLAREQERIATMDRTYIDLEGTITSIVLEAEEWCREKNISITVDFQKGLGIEADLMLFTRMMINLINNAVKYGKTEGFIKVKTCKDEGNHRVVISVEDNGHGILPGDLPHIFKRFYRGDKSRSDASSGLGLSIVEMIVKLHGGTLEVESRINEGTCFIVRFPLSIS